MEPDSVRPILECLSWEGIAVVAADGAGHVTAINAEAARLLGANPVFLLHADGHGAFCSRGETGEHCGADELPLARALRGENVSNCKIDLHLAGSPKVPLWVTARASGPGAIAIVRRRNEDPGDPDQSFRILFDSVSNGVLWRDSGGGIRSANAAAARMLGIPLDELKAPGADSSFVLFDADGKELPWDGWPWTVAARGQRAEGVLVRIVNRETGAERWVLVDAVPHPSSGQGGSHDVFVLLQDATERERAREALQRQKELLEAMFDSLPVLIGSLDVDGRLALVNREWARVLGPADSAPSRTLIDSLKQDLTWTDIAITRSDGRIIEATCTRVPLPDGTGLVTGRDTSARNAAERMLRASEERFRSLIENSSEVIIVLDEGGIIRYVSGASARASGLDPHEMTGRNAFLKIHADDLDAFRQAFGRALRSPREGVTIDVRVRDTAGNWRVWEDTITNMLDIKGVKGIVLNCREVTARKQMERELRESRDRLRQLAARIESIREQDRTRIAREVHDELGQMLTALKMGLQTLGMKAARQGVEAELLMRIDSVAAQIDETVDSVRRISSELRPGVLDHLGLASAIEWQSSEFQSRTGILCSTRIPEEDPALTAEQATAVFRIFQELLTNVARHSEASAVRVSLTADGDSLRLEVRDNGRGIQPEQITARESLGVLGMRERAGLLGGTVEFEGGPDKGTTVQVRIPMR